MKTLFLDAAAGAAAVAVAAAAAAAAAFAAAQCYVPFGELRPLPPLVLAVLGGGSAAAPTTTATALAAAALATAVAPAALLVLVAVAPFVAASGAFWLFAASTKGGDGGKQHQVKSMYPLTQQLKITDLCFTENPG